VPKDEALLGKVVDVVITSAGKHYLKCSVLSDIQRVNIPSPLPKGHISGLQATPLVRLSVSYFVYVMLLYVILIIEALSAFDKIHFA